MLKNKLSRTLDMALNVKDLVFSFHIFANFLSSFVSLMDLDTHP